MAEHIHSSVSYRHAPASRWALLSIVLAIIPAGCATPPIDPAQRAAFDEANDPLEPMNRSIFDFNDKVYSYVLFPIARGYDVLPAPVRAGVHNIFDNLDEPIVFMNKTLQGDFSSAGATLARFAVNTTVGLGGALDIATDHDLKEPKGGDFGATLATYGVGEGPYLVLPLLGPSNPRDTVGGLADGLASPWKYVLYTTYPEQLGVTAVGAVDRASRRMDEYEQAKKTSLDFYAYLRSSYRQNRSFEVGEAASTNNGLDDDAAEKKDHP